MNNPILPDHLEMDYRKNHYTRALDVFKSSAIWCVICNADIKRNVILSEKIMLHKVFLCLCCENCFNQLSDAQNKCTLCSLDTELLTCKVCDRNMCKRCTDRHFPGSTNVKKLKTCLGCSPSVLWSLRSQAAAVLKCFTLELDTRLLLNGEESEDKQNLLKYIISSTKSDKYSNEEDTHKIRISYLFDSFNSKMSSIFRSQMSWSNDFKEIANNFNDLCLQVLSNTCLVIMECKDMLKKEEVWDSLENKIILMLKNTIVFNNSENESENLTFPQAEPNFQKNKTITFYNKPTSNIKVCKVSLERLDEKTLKLYSVNKNENEGIDENPKHSSEKLMNETQSNSTKKSKKSCSSQVLTTKMKECKVLLSKLDDKTIEQFKQKSEKKVRNESVNDNIKLNAENSTETINSFNEINILNIKSPISIQDCSVVLNRLEEDIVERYTNHSKKATKNNIEKNIGPKAKGTKKKRKIESDDTTSKSKKKKLDSKKKKKKKNTIFKVKF